MDLKDYVQFATENPVAFLATIDGNQARVRTMMCDRADETGFTFSAMEVKAVSAQMHKNPNVEICFYNNPEELGNAKQMRITGRVEFLQDADSKAKAVEIRSFLDGVTGRQVSQLAEPFKISHGEVHFWMLTDACAEDEIDRLTF